MKLIMSRKSILSAVAGVTVTLMLSVPVFAQKLDETPRLAVISAFEPEWQALEKLITDRQDHTVNGVQFAAGKISDRNVVVFQSGIGPVNAAMTTQLAIDRFTVTGLVFSGVAGGINPGLNIGDVVVPDQWGQYLNSVAARETDGGYTLPPFVETDLPNFGMIHPWSVFVKREGDENPVAYFWFDVDPDYAKIASKAAKEVKLRACDSENNCLANQPQVHLGGNGVSGSVFVDNAEFREYIFKSFESHVVDMESAAVAQVSHANSLPFIAFRSLSDLAGGGPGENEIGLFLSISAENSTAMLQAFLNHYKY